MFDKKKAHTNLLQILVNAGSGIIRYSNLFRLVGTVLVPTKFVGTDCGNSACSHKACWNSCSHKFVGTDYLVFQ